jgi:hypothetical protein
MRYYSGIRLDGHRGDKKKKKKKNSPENSVAIPRFCASRIHFRGVTARVSRTGPCAPIQTLQIFLETFLFGKLTFLTLQYKPWITR